ncbi:hypothetical protein BJ742DRAFT_789089 [Cladochytrium replicatum]|nr:hypothetical protein BJ742DRAFT_789089 [Cladochytrium replicatum]
MDHECYESSSAPHMFGSIRMPRKQHTRIIPRNSQTRTGPFAPDPRLFVREWKRTHPPNDPPFHSSHQFLDPTDLIRPIPYPRPKEYTLRPLTPKNFPPSGSTGTVIPLKKPRVLAGVRMDPAPRPQPMAIATPALPPNAYPFRIPKQFPRPQSSHPADNGIDEDDQPSGVSIALSPAITNSSTTHFRKPSETILVLDSISGWADDPGEDEVATFLTSSAVAAYSYVTSSSPLLASGSYGTGPTISSQERIILEKGVGGSCVACGGSETPIPPTSTVPPALRLIHRRRHLREGLHSSESPKNGSNTESRKVAPAPPDPLKSNFDLGERAEQVDGVHRSQRSPSADTSALTKITETSLRCSQSTSGSRFKTSKIERTFGRATPDRPSSPLKPFNISRRPMSAAYESLSRTPVIATVNRPYSAEPACGLAIQPASDRHPRMIAEKTQPQRPPHSKTTALPTQAARRLIAVPYESSQPPMKAVLTGRKYCSNVDAELGRERRIKGHVQYRSASQETLIDQDQTEPFACVRAPLASGSVGD